MHLGMVAVMNAAIDMEDPFASVGVDGVYCNETLFEVEQVGRAKLDPHGIPHLCLQLLQLSWYGMKGSIPAYVGIACWTRHMRLAGKY